jgi:chitodextrinase
VEPTSPAVGPSGVTFSAANLGEGPASDIYCFTAGSETPNYIADDNHFLQPLPVTTFGDPSAPDSLCGNLEFDGRVRSFAATYITNPDNENENPWKYWWLRSRLVASTGGDLREISRDSVPGGDEASVSFDSLWLKGDYDALGVVLVLNPSGSRQISHAAFTDPEYDDDGYYNIYFQHWREKEAPVLKSVVRNGSSLTLNWDNEHTARLTDSTIIYRNGSFLTTVGPADTSYVDSGLEPGPYRYSLKHVSWPAVVSAAAVNRLPLPNSPSSNSITDTVITNYPPEARFGVTCQQLPCTFADSSSDADGPITSWRWSFGDGDSSSVQHPSHTYAAGGWYTVRLIVTDNLGAADTATGTAAPLQLGIMGPTLVKPKVTCEWDAYPQGGSGGMTYSWRIGGQEVGTDESLYRYTGTSGFQLTLIGAAGDGQADTAAVTVTLDKAAASCVLKRG